jgi:tetratricopeptide (TPR) repeat protein
MRTATALKPAYLVLFLLLFSSLIFFYGVWPSPVVIIGAFVAGMFVAQNALRLVRHRRVAAPPAAVVPGGLDRVSGSRRRQRVRPAELPPPPRLLVGRDRDIDQMWEFLSGPDRDDGPKVILIHGDPGIGKTALAIWMAHLVAEDYPDGQLLARFDGSADTQVGDRLGLFVQALKGPRDDPPASSDHQRWYRDRTQHQRVLVILDNIDNAAQIERLLPAGRRCLAIVTSRVSMPDLGRRFAVPLLPLPDADATELLDRLVGGGRVVAEPAHAERIVAAAAGYPIAIHMAGAVLAIRKNSTLKIAVQRMADIAAQRSPAQVVAFAGILDLAFALLTEDERNILVLLGLVDTRRVEPWMLAALFDGAFAGQARGPSDAARLLDRLARARLTERRVDDNSGLPTYRVPVYVHAYARTHSAGWLKEEQRARALGKLETVRQRRGERSAEKFLRDTVYRCLEEGRFDEALHTARESLALCRERAAALSADGSAEVIAAEEGLTLAALGEVYAELGWFDEAMASADAAKRRGERSPHTRPRALRVAGSLRQRQHQMAQAEADLAAAHAAVKHIDDDPEHIRVLRELIALQALRRDLPQAREHLVVARELCRRVGAPGERQLPALLLAYAKVCQACDGHAEASEALSEAERLTGDPDTHQQLWRPWIRLQRGLVLRDLGKHGQSREFSLTALEGFTGLRHRYGAAHARLALGRAYLDEAQAGSGVNGPENLAKATSPLEECHGTFRRCGDRWMEADSATALAEAYHANGRGHDAVRLLATAEQAFLKLGDDAKTQQVGHLLRLVESSLPDESESRGSGVPARLIAAGRRKASFAFSRAVS